MKTVRGQLSLFGGITPVEAPVLKNSPVKAAPPLPAIKKPEHVKINYEGRQLVFIRFNTIFIFACKPLLRLSVFSLNVFDENLKALGGVAPLRFGHGHSSLKEKQIIKLWDWFIKKGYPEAESGGYYQGFRWYVKIDPFKQAVKSKQKPAGVIEQFGKNFPEEELTLKPWQKQYRAERLAEREKYSHLCKKEERCEGECSEDCALRNSLGAEQYSKLKENPEIEIIYQDGKITGLKAVAEKKERITAALLPNNENPFYLCPRCKQNKGKALTLNFRKDIFKSDRVCWECREEMESKQKIEHKSQESQHRGENGRQRVRFIDLIHEMDKKFFKYPGILTEFMTFINANLADIESFKKYLDSPDTLKALIIDFNAVKAAC